MTKKPLRPKEIFKIFKIWEFVVFEMPVDKVWYSNLAALQTMKKKWFWRNSDIRFSDINIYVT